MGPNRAFKRVRAEDVMENFWENDDKHGIYLIIRLKSNKTIKQRGWPWVQASIRGILGNEGKVEKANFLTNGDLLVKTKNEKQTEQLLKATMFGGENCEVEKDKRLNVSRGTILAHDLTDVCESEIVSWFEGFGVVSAKRFTKRVNGKTENTPIILLTFDRPTCPAKLDFDYVSYKVKKHIPNPLMCYQCGKFGHAEAKCVREAVCMTCGKEKHDGDCSPKCVNCDQEGHSCRSRDCPAWKKEKQICELKVEREVSYAQARDIYEKSHLTTPVTKQYAAVVRSLGESQGQDTVAKDRSDKLEGKLETIITLLNKVLTQQLLIMTNKDQHKCSCTQQHQSDGTEVEIEVPNQVPDSQPDDDLPISGVSGVSGEIEDELNQNHSDLTGNQKTAENTPWNVVRNKKGKPKKCTENEHVYSDDGTHPSPQIGTRQPRSTVQKETKKKMPTLTKCGHAMET